MIYPYGNCSAVPSPQSLAIYYSNVMNYSTSLAAYVIGGRAPIFELGPLLVDDPAILSLITLTPEASEFYHCLQYYCDQSPDIQTITESREVCTESDSITALTSFIVEDPTAMSVVSHKVEERVYVYSPAPITEEEAQDKIENIYIVLHGRSRNGTIPAIAITVPTISKCVNITITTPVDAVIYRARYRDEFLNSTLANTTVEVSCLMYFEVIWIEPRIDSCNNDGPNLQGTIIKSTIDIATYVAEAGCNVTTSDRGFGYVGNLINALPPMKRWGTMFIVDLGHLQNQLLLQGGLAAVFYAVTVEKATVTVTAYKPDEKTLVRSKEYKLESKQPLTIKVEELHTQIHVLQSSTPVFVVCEVYSEVSGEPYFSTLLQPVEWFTHQQSLLLARSLVTQQEHYYITLVITTDSESYDLTEIQVQNGSHEQSVSLPDYTPFHDGELHSYPVGSSGYMIVSIAVDSTALDSNNTYLTVKSCTKLGASVFYHGESSSYAHTNSYILGESFCSVICQCSTLYFNTDESPLADNAACSLATEQLVKQPVIYAMISGVIGGLLLVTIIVTSIVLCVHPPGTHLPPGPPYEGRCMCIPTQPS